LLPKCKSFSQFRRNQDPKMNSLPHLSLKWCARAICLDMFCTWTVSKSCPADFVLELIPKAAKISIPISALKTIWYWSWLAN
jgi:hypothetical protein